MKNWLRVGLALALAPVAPAAGGAPLSDVAWPVPQYSLTARDLDLRAAFDAFAAAEGVPVLCSEAVRGKFSGDFKDVPAAEFLARLAAVHNLNWYYDGASIFVSTVAENVSTLIDLKYMRADEVCALLAELGVEDARFPIKRAAAGELIMVSGPPRYVAIVAEMIAKADKLRERRTFTAVETRIFPLKHTWADNVSFHASSPEGNASIRGVAYLLQEIMSGDRGRAPGATNALAAAAADAVSPAIRPDNRLNAVVVRDAAVRMPSYERLIAQLDVPQRLVEIEVTTIELSRDDSLDWQLSLKVEGARGEFEGAAGQNAANLFSAADLAGKGAAGAASYLGRHVNISASIDALRSQGKARSVSRSTILTLNNLAAAMTDSQSYHARVVGTEVATLEEVSAGTRLEVKPRVLEPEPGDTNAQLRVFLTMSLQDGGFEALTVDSMPMTRTTTLDTQAVVPENGALLLAGYLRDIEEEAGWGIPYLRDLPLIGWLFGGSSRTTQTVQRMFVIVPHIVDVSIAPPAEQPEKTAAEQAARARDLEAVERLGERLRQVDEAAGERRREREAAREAAGEEPRP